MSTSASGKIVDQAFKEAIRNGVFPSAAVIAGKEGNKLFEGYYGGARNDTCFDIASLTKPVATATLVMLLVSEGLLKYSDTVYQWLAGARQPAHRKMTVQHLLNHMSGLPAWQPYYRELPISLVGTQAAKNLIFNECFAEPTIAEPGEKTIYSDIGYMILGAIVEEAGSATLDVLFAQHVARPLGLSNTFFVKLLGAAPADKDKTTDNKQIAGPSGSGSKMSDKQRRFAPTEDCPWRGKVVKGEVHDPNAYALGGIAGHAGLFSTAEDLHNFATAICQCYQGKSDWLPPNIIMEHLGKVTKKPEESEYTSGWCRPSRHRSASGRYFSANTIGHLGYTGCSMWIDLKKKFHIILLTNRIHPSATNEKIKSFRPEIHDLIYKEIIKDNL